MADINANRKRKDALEGDAAESADSSGTGSSAYNEALLSAGGTSSGSSSSDDYEDLRNQNYKNLLDNQIQLESARQSAMKASRSQLASQGLFGTGYGSLANTGISNAYINAMNSANTSFAETDADISAKEKAADEEKASSNFTTLTTLMGQAEDMDDLSAVLSEYGITLNDDGTFSGDYYDAMDDDSKKQFGVTYRLLANAKKYSGQTGYGDYASMINGLTMTNGESANTGSHQGLQDEVEALFSSGDRFAKEGTVVKLSNGNNRDNVAFVVYHNGKWYSATSGDYATAKSKAEIKKGRIVS